MKLTRRLAAEAIRRHLWQPTPPGPLGGRPWTMARELQIFDRLTRTADALEVLGAIENIRAVTGARGPIRLTWFIHRQRGRALFSRSVAAYHASTAPPGAPRGGGLDRVTVGLPPLTIEVTR